MATCVSCKKHICDCKIDGNGRCPSCREAAEKQQLTPKQNVDSQTKKV